MAGRVVGCVNVVTSAAIAVAYLPCLKVIGFDQDLKSSSCFRIMYHLGISDTLLLATQGLFAAFTALGVNRDIPEWLNCRLAPLAGSCWFSGTGFLLLLALNRFSVITNKLSFLFTDTVTSILIAVNWLYSLAWLVALELPQVGYCYYPSTQSFYFGLSSQMSELAKQMNWIHNNLTLIPSIVCYLVAFYTARKERKATASAHKELNASLKESEYLLLKQGAMIFGYCFVESQYWHLAPALAGHGFVHAFALGNWLWLSNVGINPLVYLGMNKTIYNKVRDMFFGKQPKPAYKAKESMTWKKTQSTPGFPRADGAAIVDIE